MFENVYQIERASDMIRIIQKAVKKSSKEKRGRAKKVGNSLHENISTLQINQDIDFEPPTYRLFQPHDPWSKVTNEIIPSQCK
jgi:hypothetical protein